MRADSISFSFTASHSEPLKASDVTYGAGNGAGGVANVPITGTSISVSDTATSNVFALPGTVTVAIIPIGSGTYTPSATGLVANYLGASAATTVDIDSALCVGGAMPGVCLAGDENEGTYTASVTGTQLGAFAGNFVVTYVSPYVTSLFADVPPSSSTPGTDAFTTDTNHFASNFTPKDGLEEGSFTGGTGTIVVTNVGSIVPEPSSLLFLGTGLLTLAGGLGLRFRRKNSSNSTTTAAF